MRNAIIDNLAYAHEHGTDRPEIAELDVAVLSASDETRGLLPFLRPGGNRIDVRQR